MPFPLVLWSRGIIPASPRWPKETTKPSWLPHIGQAPCKWPTGHGSTFLSPSLFFSPFSYPGHRDLFQRPEFFFLIPGTTTLHDPTPPTFVLVFILPATPIKPAGALDGYDHHDSDQRRFEFTSKSCPWTLIFVPDDEPDASGYPENFAFATALDLTQSSSSKPGEHTVFRYGCNPRGCYGYPEPHKQQQREQREPEQRV